MRARRLLFRGGFALVVVGVIAFAAIKNRTVHLPSPSGPLLIGRTEFIWTDNSRTDPWLPAGKEKRELKVNFWYPGKSEGPGRQAVYFPDLPKMSHFSALEKLFIGQVAFNALDSPAVASSDKPFPVVIFSPGANTPCDFYAGIIQELVSQGYVVAAIDHTYEGVGQVLSGGRLTDNFVERLGIVDGKPLSEPRMADRFKKRIGVRSDDISFVLSKVEELNKSDGKFHGKLDMRRCGVPGHSMGGKAAALAAAKDHRFKAAVNMDGLDHGQARQPNGIGATMDAAFLHLGKPIKELTDEELTSRKIDKAKYAESGRQLRARMDGVMKEVKGGAYRAMISFAEHMSFSDNPFLDPRVGLRQRDVLPIQRRLVLEFFDVTLCGAKPNLLNASSPFPDVSVERWSTAAITQ